MRVSAETNRLRQGYGGPPKLYAKVEASALRRIEMRAHAADAALQNQLGWRRWRTAASGSLPAGSPISLMYCCTDDGMQVKSNNF